MTEICSLAEFGELLPDYIITYQSIEKEQPTLKYFVLNLNCSGISTKLLIYKYYGSIVSIESETNFWNCIPSTASLFDYLVLDVECLAYPIHIKRCTYTQN